ncbi:MAG TPA: hypothetical protein VN255_17745 [Mycobacterium sp.]|nr:hypothetical protein [Mycobacterium sp.]
MGQLIIGAVTYEQNGAVGIVTLRQPPQNRLNATMIEELESGDGGAIPGQEADHERLGDKRRYAPSPLPLRDRDLF